MRLQIFTHPSNRGTQAGVTPPDAGMVVASAQEEPERAMRIVDISNHYCDKGGGVRTYHRQKFEYFARHEEHSYALIAPGEDNRTLELPGGRLHYVKGFPVSAKDSPKGYRLMADANRVRQIFKLERPDIVEVGAPYYDSILAQFARLYCDPVFVGFYHLEFRDAHIEPGTQHWPRWLQSATLRFLDRYLKVTYQDAMSATFVASQVVKDELAQIGIHNTILTPLGVDTRKFDPARRDDELRSDWRAGPGDRVLLHAGRLSKEKGTDAVLAAAPALLEDPSVHLVIAGRGGLTGDVEALAAEHPRVHFMGFVSDPTLMGAIFASSDIYLGTGPYETFGLCILEALASGLPVVATDEGAGMELAVNSRCGVLFKAGDPESLAEKVGELLMSDLVMLGERARRWAVQHGSWNVVFDRMYRHYGKLLASDRRVAGPVLETEIRAREPGLQPVPVLRRRPPYLST